MTKPIENEVEAKELEHRVFFSLLGLVVSAADRLGLSLKDVTRWVRVAYVKELKDQGLSYAQIGDRLGTSERTIKNVARELRESFFLPEQEHNLPTRIEFMLWRTPMSEARLKQVLDGVEAEEVDTAIALLLDQGRIEVDDSERTPTYVPTQSVNSQVSPEWVQRIGALNSLASNLYDTVEGRFFRMDPRAFARTLSFLIRPSNYADLEELFWETLVPFIAGLDEEAHDADEADPIRLTMFWSPTSGE